jgi:hypothetical protein
MKCPHCNSTFSDTKRGRRRHNYRVLKTIPLAASRLRHYMCYKCWNVFSTEEKIMNLTAETRPAEVRPPESRDNYHLKFDSDNKNKHTK